MASLSDEKAALSMRFKLFPSRRSNILATPCLNVQLNNVEIVRLLDPELGEGFVSGARLFIASGIPLLDALVRFDLHKPDYDVHLGKLAPFDDIWLPLSTARDIADRLGVAEELSRLLDPATRTAWSLDDGDEGGMLHNWKIPQEYLAPSSYSVNAMQGVEFGRIAILQSGSQIRTPIDRPALRDIFTQKFAGQQAFFGSKPEHLLSILVSWLILLYEEWTDHIAANAGAGENTAFDYSMDTTFLFRALVSANIVAGTITSQEERKVRIADGQLSFGKEDLDPSSATARLAFVDLFSRLALKGYGQKEIRPRKENTATGEPAEAIPSDSLARAPSPIIADEGLDVKEQLSELKERILALEQAATNPSPIPSAPYPPRPRSASRQQTQVEALASLRPATIILFMIVSYILVHRVLAFIDESIRVAQITMRRPSGEFS